MVIGPDIITDVGALSYAGVFILSLLANIFIPVPEEIILLALGYVVGVGILSGYVVLPIVIVGLLLSDMVLFILSKRGSRIVQWLYHKFFEKRIAKKGKRWVRTNIGKIIVVSRFLVQFRFLGPFLAGERKIKTKTFVMYDLLGLVLYVPLYVLLGALFHSKVRYIIDKVGVVQNIVFMAVILLILFAMIRFVYKFFFKKDETENEQPI
jgi:membrane-associated protein